MCLRGLVVTCRMLLYGVCLIVLFVCVCFVFARFACDI